MKRLTLAAPIVGFRLLFASPDTSAAQSKSLPAGAYRDAQ
jgi:hypothetical protein